MSMSISTFYLLALYLFVDRYCTHVLYGVDVFSICELLEQRDHVLLLEAERVLKLWAKSVKHRQNATSINSPTFTRGGDYSYSELHLSIPQLLQGVETKELPTR